jgi:serine/threonine protein kinase
MMTNLIGQSLGRYHILEQLGEGGMATVYKAYDTRLETDVAVKVIRTENILPSTLEKALKRFEREAKSLAKLTHTNIVKVTDYGEYEGKPYLVMPYLPGGTLKQRLGKPMPWQEAMKLLHPIARALEFAHSQEMIHRDVKPSNILLTQSGTPMLADFGVAKILDMESTQDLTGTGVAVGTPEYMAPEQWIGRTSTKSDQYGLGIILYEMLTGRKPYTADTPAAILLKQANDPLPRPSQFTRDLPEKVEKLLLKALAKDPVDRFDSMGDFANEMGSILAGTSAPVVDQPVRPRGRGSDSMTTIDQSQEEPPPRESLKQLTRTQQAGSPSASAGLMRYWPIGLVGILVLVGLFTALLLKTRPVDHVTPPPAAHDGVTISPPPAAHDGVTISPPLPVGDAPISPTYTPSVTSSPTHTPTATLTRTPTPALPDPAEFIYWYFDAICSQRNYKDMWQNYQTAAFHQSSANNDYQGFVDYYNTVDWIEVTSVNTNSNDGRTAFVEVGLVFHMKAGWNDSATITYKLIYNKSKAHWIFDKK